MTRIAVKSVTDTIVGEGARAGSRAVMVRFSGCNLWDGNPLHRDQGAAACAFYCDADFLRGTPMEEYTLLAMMDEQWEKPADGSPRACILTGGEPLEQVGAPLVTALRDEGWLVTVETNGTHPPPPGIDHLVVSPKRGVAVLDGITPHEVRVVLPGNGGKFGAWTDADLDALAERFPHAALFVVPEDVVTDPTVLPPSTLLRHGGVDDEEQDALLSLQFQQHMNRAITFVKTRPRWRLSPQVQKLIGLP